MCDIHCRLRGWRGRPVTGVFQTLSPGKTRQPPTIGGCTSRAAAAAVRRPVYDDPDPTAGATGADAAATAPTSPTTTAATPDERHIPVSSRALGGAVPQHAVPSPVVRPLGPGVSERP